MNDKSPQATSPNNLMEVEDVDVHFYAQKGLFQRVTIRAVTTVSLAVQKGETVALVGESGSGKTTLGRATLRLLRPVHGHVRFDGVDITNLSERQLKGFRREAQAVFQDPYSSLNPYMNISQIVEEPLIIHNIGNRAERSELVHKALEDVRLSPTAQLMSTFPHTLSGGQRQRLGIARALVLQPRYVVADEPVSMIDASSRAELLYLMRDLQERYGIAFLYVTHDIASARHFSNRIAVMYLGSIVELGLPEAVVESPFHPYTRALIDAVPEPDPANRLHERPVVPGEPPNPANVPSGCPFHPRCPRFMPGLCDQARPELREVQPGHYASCYLYEEAGQRYAEASAKPMP